MPRNKKNKTSNSGNKNNNNTSKLSSTTSTPTPNATSDSITAENNLANDNESLKIRLQNAKEQLSKIQDIVEVIQIQEPTSSPGNIVLEDENNIFDKLKNIKEAREKLEKIQTNVNTIKSTINEKNENVENQLKTNDKTKKQTTILTTTANTSSSSNTKLITTPAHVDNKLNLNDIKNENNDTDGKQQQKKQRNRNKNKKNNNNNKLQENCNDEIVLIDENNSVQQQSQQIETKEINADKEEDIGVAEEKKKNKRKNKKSKSNQQLVIHNDETKESSGVSGLQQEISNTECEQKKENPIDHAIKQTPTKGKKRKHNKDEKFETVSPPKQIIIDDQIIEQKQLIVDENVVDLAEETIVDKEVNDGETTIDKEKNKPNKIGNTELNVSESIATVPIPNIIHIDEPLVIMPIIEEKQFIKTNTIDNFSKEDLLIEKSPMIETTNSIEAPNTSEKIAVIAVEEKQLKKGEQTDSSLTEATTAQISKIEKPSNKKKEKKKHNKSEKIESPTSIPKQIPIDEHVIITPIIEEKQLTNDKAVDRPPNEAINIQESSIDHNISEKTTLNNSADSSETISKQIPIDKKIIAPIIEEKHSVKDEKIDCLPHAAPILEEESKTEKTQCNKEKKKTNKDRKTVSKSMDNFTTVNIKEKKKQNNEDGKNDLNSSKSTNSPTEQKIIDTKIINAIVEAKPLKSNENIDIFSTETLKDDSQIEKLTIVKEQKKTFDNEKLSLAKTSEEQLKQNDKMKVNQLEVNITEKSMEEENLIDESLSVPSSSEVPIDKNIIKKDNTNISTAIEETKNINRTIIDENSTQNLNVEILKQIPDNTNQIKLPTEKQKDGKKNKSELKKSNEKIHQKQQIVEKKTINESVPIAPEKVESNKVSEIKNIVPPPKEIQSNLERKTIEDISIITPVKEEQLIKELGEEIIDQTVKCEQTKGVKQKPPSDNIVIKGVKQLQIQPIEKVPVEVNSENNIKINKEEENLVKKLDEDQNSEINQLMNEKESKPDKELQTKVVKQSTESEVLMQSTETTEIQNIKKNDIKSNKNLVKDTKKEIIKPFKGKKINESEAIEKYKDAVKLKEIKENIVKEIEKSSTETKEMEYIAENSKSNKEIKIENVSTKVEIQSAGTDLTEKSLTSAEKPIVLVNDPKECKKLTTENLLTDDIFEITTQPSDRIYQKDDKKSPTKLTELITKNIPSSSKFDKKKSMKMSKPSTAELSKKIDSSDLQNQSEETSTLDSKNNKQNEEIKIGSVTDKKLKKDQTKQKLNKIKQGVPQSTFAEPSAISSELSNSSVVPTTISLSSSTTPNNDNKISIDMAIMDAPATITDNFLVEDPTVTAEALTSDSQIDKEKLLMAQISKNVQGSDFVPSVETKSLEHKIITTKSQFENPIENKMEKDRKNLQQTKESLELKHHELPEKTAQEKLDSINFSDIKLINILEANMVANKIPNKQISSKCKENKKNNDILQLKTSDDESIATTSRAATINKKPEIPLKPQHLLKNQSKKASKLVAPSQFNEAIPTNSSALIKSLLSSSPLTVTTTTTEDEDLAEEEDFIEFKFTPRQIFMSTICQICKVPLKQYIHCNKCEMVYYCSEQHRDNDVSEHMQFCGVIQEIARKRGGHIYNNARILNDDDFRSLRVHTLNICENLLNRRLQPFEREILLFPRLCCTTTCREWRHQLLENCKICGQVSYCTAYPEHLQPIEHEKWCNSFLLYQQLVLRQKTFGRIEPSLPTKIIQSKQYNISHENIDNVFKELYKNYSSIKDECTYSTLTQLATAPLTAYYGSQIAQQQINEIYVIHLIGSEIQFEADKLDKWEAFFLHLIPQLVELHIVFIGPELNVENLPLEILSRIRMCRTCRQLCRCVKFDFQCGKLYHEYANSTAFRKPNLICYFNPGLYRSTGFNGLDTWPETIKSSLQFDCPIIVTSYTEMESPRDLQRIQQESLRELKIIKLPNANPFSSHRPERNFISDEIAPMIFKNFYYFIVK